MKSATIVDLRNHLSDYLRQVEAGETILVLRREEPIAELRPPSASLAERAASSEPRLRELEGAGLIRRGHGRWPAWVSKPLTGPPASVLEALLAEREEGR